MVKLLVICVLLMYIVGEMGVYSDCCLGYQGQCLDGTEATPYCGYGGCNIFGCNCVCRRGRRKRDTNQLNSPNAFETMDKNQSGHVDKDKDSHLLSTKCGTFIGNFTEFEKQFSKFDKDGDGKLSFAEINAAG